MLIELIILILAIPQLVTFTLESRKISWKNNNQPRSLSLSSLDQKYCCILNKHII
jgi:hypothetical protein